MSGTSWQGGHSVCSVVAKLTSLIENAHVFRNSDCLKLPAVTLYQTVIASAVWLRRHNDSLGLNVRRFCPKL